MNWAVALAIVACTLHAATTITMFLLGRAPGWARVRIVGFIALTATCYNAIDIWAVSGHRSDAALGWVLRLNLSNAALHAAAWIWFTFADADGRWASVPRRVRRGTLAALGVVLALAASGLVVSSDPPMRLWLPSVGVEYDGPRTSLLGDLGVAVVFALFFVVVWTQARRALDGDRSARRLFAGYVVFLACTIEEALVTAGVFEFVFLADLGFVFAVLPIGWDIVTRFLDDARRLQAQTAQLAGEVQARTQERDAAREALVEQERLAALGRLAAGVGHEVNNPLQYLQFSLEELREVFRERGHPEPEVLQDAFDGADRIRRVVEGLRVYSAGAATEIRTPVDVREVVRTALRVAGPQLRHVAKIETALEDVPLVLADEARLVQVVVNPLVNAAQALAGTSRPGIIGLWTRTSPAGDALIEISDNGTGISPEVLARLGEPYVTTRARTGGTGLGLFVTRGIVDAHGGTLHVESKTGGGTRVVVRLPAMPRGVETPRPSQPVAIPGEAAAADGPRTVLLVDDDPLVLATLGRALERRGFAVEGTTSAAEALARIERATFDAVVTDLMMPGMSGVDLADALAARHPRLRERMSVITGGAVTESSAEFLARPDVVSFIKPVNLDGLVAALRRWR